MSFKLDYAMALVRAEMDKSYVMPLEASYKVISDLDNIIVTKLTRIDELEQRNRELVERIESIRSKCKIVYFPSNNEYPIEHAPLANKDNFDAIIEALAKAGGL